MTWVIAAALLFASPPPVAETDRKVRVAEIYAMADARDDYEIGRYAALQGSLTTPWEQAAWIQGLQNHHREAARQHVARLVHSADVGVRSAAAIKHYSWTFSPSTLVILEQLRGAGASVRRAFQTGEKAGRPLYHASALSFFQKGLKHPLIYARLDSALGMIELGERHHRAGLTVVEAELAASSATDRLLAVKYMRVAWPEPAFVPLLRAAARDTDPRVRDVAISILSRFP